MKLITGEKEIRHAHIFCGLGGGAKGFNRGKARVGNIVGKFRCVGGIDNNAAACRDFRKIAKATATCMDLFTREQYVAFHKGEQPPAEWREAQPVDVRMAFGAETPHIVFLSAPCKGFSGLLSEKNSATPKYQALNGLTLRGVWLVLEAYKDDPVSLIVFENVPRIATRGRWFLDQIIALLRAHGYAVNESDHDCGELGGLGQSRKRYLLVARHMAKVPPFLYQPDKRKLLSVGQVLEKLPLPLSGLGGPMHRMPALQWKTWVRLAFVRAGADWRSLNELAVEGGNLRDFGIMPTGQWHNGAYGVKAWTETGGVVTSGGRPGQGEFAVADPRPGELVSKDRPAYGVNPWDQPGGTVINVRSPGQGCHAVQDIRVNGHPKSVQMGVSTWDQTGPVVTGKMFVGGGRHAVGDPRLGGKRFNSTFRIVKWGQHSPAVAGPGGPGGGLGVADPRPGYGDAARKNVLRVGLFDQHAGTVTSGHSPSNGANAVADPRVEAARNGSMGVKGWQDTGCVVGGQTMPSNGPHAVADPRPTHGPNAHTHKMAVQPWDGEPARTVTGSDRVGSGAACVADPRCVNYGPSAQRTRFQVSDWENSSKTVTGGTHVQSGAQSVADPRPNANMALSNRGNFGVVTMDQVGYAITGHGQYDNGYNSVADERLPAIDGEPATLPGPAERLVCVILSLDNTWHRPFTTLELAALQGMVDPDEQFELDGMSDSAWRERIGNGVPPPSAEAIASLMGETLLLAWAGETFTLSSKPIWVRNAAIALSVPPDHAVMLDQ